MSSLEEQIVEVEDEIRNTQYNKATSRHIGRLRAKLAVLRITRETRSKGKGGGSGYSVRKSGHATVGLVGYPSVGKSTLLTALTGARSETGAYDFTTLSIIPGMLRFGGASIQILDMPGLVPGAARGRGRGREVLSVVRSVDLVLFLIDPEHSNFKALYDELESSGVRINTRPGRIVISPAMRGGLTISATVKLTKMDEETVAAIAKEFGFHNGSIVIREDATPEQLIDTMSGNRVYLSAIVAVNKAELMTEADRKAMRAKLKPFEPVFLSAKTGAGVPETIEAVARSLAFIRIYLKPPGREPDRVEPVILRKGDRVSELLNRLPEDLGGAFRAALVWGPSARFPGQSVGKDHRLQDEDVVTVLVVRGGRTAS
ncbi:MAG: 50S ribosome-binding GTPase [Thermoplasmata archaeon]|nr:50S ribosome-binding GTPase [Thermoplasmata archaeon]